MLVWYPIPPFSAVAVWTRMLPNLSPKFCVFLRAAPRSWRIFDCNAVLRLDLLSLSSNDIFFFITHFLWHTPFKYRFALFQVACKYLHDPLLFDRPGVGKVKFDVRYCVLLSSVDPLVAHTYNVFWLRFANLPYALERLVCPRSGCPRTETESRWRETRDR